LSSLTLIKPEPDQLYRLNRFYKKNGHKGKATPEDVAFWLEQSDQILAAVRFHNIGAGLLMRGLWVHKAQRQSGLGSALLEQTRDFWQQQACYCFPYAHLQTFYRQNGFTLIADRSGNITDTQSIPVQLVNQLRSYHQRDEDLLLMAYQPPCD